MPESSETRTETATVRKAPKYSVFMGLGAAAGIIVSFVLAYSFLPEQSDATGVTYSQGQVFGFVMLYAVPAGLALGALVALLLDRTVGRRTREVRVEHDRVRDVPDQFDE